MSILVTGGAGYIGSHTCIELIKAGYDIVVVDNFYNSKPEALKRIAELSGKQFTFYECDIRDAEGMSKVFESEKIDAVIHFAGFTYSLKTCKMDNSFNVVFLENGFDCGFIQKIGFIEFKVFPCDFFDSV